MYQKKKKGYVARAADSCCDFQRDRFFARCADIAQIQIIYHNIIISGPATKKPPKTCILNGSSHVL